MMARSIPALLCCSVLALGQTGRILAGQPTPPRLPNVEASGCPEALETSVPAPASLLPSDFVELRRSECYGACPAYTIRIQADGRTVWRGEKYVTVTGE